MKEFQAVFQMSKTIIFEVRYYTLDNNSRPYFTTSAAQFYRNKKDYSRCGQAQPELLKGYRTARQFFEKWDVYHLHDLTPEQYNEMRHDLETLKEKYNFIFEELDESRRPYSPRFSFNRLAKWTKQEPKKDGKLPTSEEVTK